MCLTYTDPIFLYVALSIIYLFFTLSMLRLFTLSNIFHCIKTRVNLSLPRQILIQDKSEALRAEADAVIALPTPVPDVSP